MKRNIGKILQEVEDENKWKHCTGAVKFNDRRSKAVSAKLQHTILLFKQAIKGFE